MKCPNCNVALVMADRSGIEIDYCPECRGVWLDRGELDKIIERSTTTINSPTRTGNIDYNHSDRRYPQQRKKGLFGELFDF